MSLRILKPGLYDSFRNSGFSGAGSMGINPDGAMDMLAMKTANALVGNNLQDAVIELHYPAASFLVEQDAVLGIAGANFGATINNDTVFGCNHTAFIKAGSVLAFNQKISGERVYLAVQGGFAVQPGLNRFKIAGAAAPVQQLTKHLRIPFNQTAKPFEKNCVSAWQANILPWYADMRTVNILPGPEWDLLPQKLQADFVNHLFTVSSKTNRMGCQLTGEPLELAENFSMVSSGVTNGTLQLLPGGQLLVLTAGHQTTGGYPRIAQIITAHQPKFSQLSPGMQVRFAMTTQKTAELLLANMAADIAMIAKGVQMHLAMY